MFEGIVDCNTVTSLIYCVHGWYKELLNCTDGQTGMNEVIDGREEMK